MAYQRTEIVRPKGINKDLSPFELPPEVWSDGLNVNFRRQRTNSSLGYSANFTLADSIISPLHIIYFTDGVDTLWAYGNEDKIYGTDGESAVELGTGYNATREDNWTSCNFNGVFLMNNRVDHPQVSDPATNLMEDLPNWTSVTPWGLSSRCEIIRPYKNYLMAMDCYDEVGQRYPLMIRWSSPAEAGDVPPSWDASIPGEQAGLYSLSDTPGRIVDGLTLGDYFVVYKTDAVWLIQFIGGDFTFSFRKLFGDEAGALTKECIAEFEGQHFVMSPTGAYVHNAASKSEIMEPWVKDAFFLKVAPERMLETKVVADHNNKEIWVYFVTRDAYELDVDAWPDRALVWNWEVQEWTIKELTGISHIAEGIIEPSDTVGVDDWDSDNQIWNEDDTRWDSETPFNPSERGLLLADYANNLFYANENDQTLAGATLHSFVERVGIDFNDDNMFKYVTAVTPHIIGEQPVTVSLFTSDRQTTVPTLEHKSEYDPKEDYRVDCHVMGRYIGVRFESDDLFTLTGYTIEWEPAGQY
jgi:hypothetical protein